MPNQYVRVFLKCSYTAVHTALLSRLPK